MLDNNDIFAKIKPYFFEFIIYMLIIIVCLGMHFISFSMNNDELFDILGEATSIYYAADRWGHGLYRECAGVGTAHWIAPMMGSIFIAVSWVIQSHLLKLTSWISRIIFVTAYLSCTYTFQFYIFSMHIDAIGFAILLCSVSVFILFTNKAGIVKCLMSALMLSIALGVYQLNAVVFVGLALAVLMTRVITQEESINLRLLTKIILTTIVGIILWKLIANECNKFAPEGVQAFTNNHHKNFSILAPDFLAIPIKESALIISHYLFYCISKALGLNAQANQWYLHAYTFTIIPLLQLIIYFFKNPRSLSHVCSIIFVIGIWIAPFIMHLVLFRYNFTSSLYYAAAFSSAFLWILAWHTCKKYHLNIKLQLSILILCSVVLIRSAYHYSQEEENCAYTYEKNISDLKEVEQMRQNRSFEKNRNIRVKIVSYSLDSSEPDQGIKFNAFLSYLKFDYIREEELTSRDLQALETMKIWPDVDSVRYIDDYLLVRMDNFWSRQRGSFVPTLTPK